MGGLGHIQPIGPEVLSPPRRDREERRRAELAALIREQTEQARLFSRQARILERLLARRDRAV